MVLRRHPRGRTGWLRATVQLMAVISIANAKGGSGKTTAAVLLATELAVSGFRTALFDCDDLKLAAVWARASGLGSRLTLVDGVTVANLANNLRAVAGSVDHVIIDLSGARDVLVALTVGLSDLALVPVQGCAMDSRGASQVLELIDFVGANSRMQLNRAVVLSRVNPLVTTRALRSVKALLCAKGIPLIDTPIIERSAYRDMFETGGTLYSASASRISNLDKAQANMRAFVDDVLHLAGAMPGRDRLPAAPRRVTAASPSLSLSGEDAGRTRTVTQHL